MKSNIFNLGLEEANLSKLELANLIKKFIPHFKIVQSEYGKDPDKRNYIVSNKKINDIGFLPSWSLEKGIKELVRGMPLVGKKIWKYLNMNCRSCGSTKISKILNLGNQPWGNDFLSKNNLGKEKNIP